MNLYVGSGYTIIQDIRGYRCESSCRIRIYNHTRQDIQAYNTLEDIEVILHIGSGYTIIQDIR